MDRKRVFLFLRGLANLAEKRKPCEEKGGAQGWEFIEGSLRAWDCIRIRNGDIKMIKKMSESEEKQQWVSLIKKGKGKGGNCISYGLNNRSHRVILLLYCI